jgi:glycosyltransferase involved in cell wall biosynthesis
MAVHIAPTLKLAVVTATCRTGGIDVLEASLLRQTYRNFMLLVVDEFEREGWWNLVGEKNEIDVINIKPPYINKSKGEVRNLARAYNLAIEYALDYKCDLFVSLQDYIWVQKDGLERFIYRANFNIQRPLLGRDL